MSSTSNIGDDKYDVLRRLRDARRDLHALVTESTGMRERSFAPAQLVRTLREHVSQSSIGSVHERCSRLFVLTVLLYGALDWHFAGHGIDIEADVQLERIRQDHCHGGVDADDQLRAQDWELRLQEQVVRLEAQVTSEEGYAARLIKLTALAQAALEAAHRQSRRQ